MLTNFNLIKSQLFQESDPKILDLEISCTLLENGEVELGNSKYLELDVTSLDGLPQHYMN